MTNYLDIAYELNKLEQMGDTYMSKKLIEEIRFEALSDNEIDWKEYFFRLAELVESLLVERYNDGYNDAENEYSDEWR